MKKPESRDILIEKIDNFIENSNPDRIKSIEQEIRHDDRISLGTFMRIISGRFDLHELRDAELYWLTVAIHNASKKFPDAPEDYFEQVEINNYRFMESVDDSKVGYPIVFRDVVKLADNQYLFPLAVREIKKLKNNNILQIIPELQRNAKKDKYGDLKTKVNKETALTISSLINEGQFFYNGVRFNLMDDGECDSPIYDEDNRTLTVTNGTIIVPDGNHRTISCELATRHLDDKFGVFFTYLSAQQTRLLLNQEWTTVPIPKRHKDAMKPTVANKIVDSIMRSGDIDDIYVRGIVKDGQELKSNNGFILYIELSSAIQKYYDTESLKIKADQDELRDWLITYMNYLAKVMYDDFNDFAKVKKDKWSVHYLAWYYYIMISKRLWKNPDWREILENTIKSTDFVTERDIFLSYNKRKLFALCDREEERLCITLSKRNNS